MNKAHRITGLEAQRRLLQILLESLELIRSELLTIDRAVERDNVREMLKLNAEIAEAVRKQMSTLRPNFNWCGFRTITHSRVLEPCRHGGRPNEAARWTNAS